jgi:hypothetical protein
LGHSEHSSTKILVEAGLIQYFSEQSIYGTSAAHRARDDRDRQEHPSSNSYHYSRKICIDFDTAELTYRDRDPEEIQKFALLDNFELQHSATNMTFANRYDDGWMFEELLYFSNKRRKEINRNYFLSETHCKIYYLSHKQFVSLQNDALELVYRLYNLRGLLAAYELSRTKDLLFNLMDVMDFKPKRWKTSDGC